MNTVEALPLRAALPALTWNALEVTTLSFRLLDDPLEQPVRTSFGVMRTRPALLVRLTDAAGRCGHGEVWCNFPRGGARYKATLLAEYVAPAVEGGVFAAPQEIAARARERLAVLALQCADHGAIEQLLAGLDQAAWDLHCKAAGAAFWQLARAAPRVAVYASGIGPREVGATIAREHAAGHRFFKVKIGFGDDTDRALLREALTAVAALPDVLGLAVDVNQGWTPAQARAWLPRLAAEGLAWCEEPVRADTPWRTWHELALAAPGLRLAAGENLLRLEDFRDASLLGGIRVLQPDLGKWGGVSGALALAAAWPAPQDAPLAAPTWLCPHWLAGGIGLAASLQLKAALGGAGPLEVDANPNRQRSAAFATPLPLEEGHLVLPDTPGLVPPLADWLAEPAAWQRRSD